MFTDKIWAIGGVHTVSYVTVKKDGSEDTRPENLTHKYTKAPSWMFWGSIIDGQKGPSRFWEKAWGSIDSVKYNEHILCYIEGIFREHPEYWFIQDNAPSHRSRLTRTNLAQKGIPCIDWPAYSPDLNIIEHVWNWMKNWMQENYWQARYDVAKVPLSVLRGVIQEAWDSCPNSYIQDLFDSFPRRCQAVVEARGGLTRY